MIAANSETVEATNDPLKSVATAIATAAEAVRDGAGDAFARARQAVPVTTEAVSRFVYSGCYYASYGVVFPTMLVANFLPGGGPIATGLLDGANAATSVIGGMKEKAAARKAAKSEEPAASA